MENHDIVQHISEGYTPGNGNYDSDLIKGISSNLDGYDLEINNAPEGTVEVEGIEEEKAVELVDANVAQNDDDENDSNDDDDESEDADENNDICAVDYNDCNEDESSLKIKVNLSCKRKITALKVRRIGPFYSLHAIL